MENIVNFLKDSFAGTELRQDELNELKQFGYDSKMVRPETLQKAMKATPFSMLPTNIGEVIKATPLGKFGQTLDNVAYGSFSIPFTNWGGALYSAGKTFGKNQIITPDDLDTKPTNKADELFMLHDIDYQESSTRPTQQQRKEQLMEADRAFIERARDLLSKGDLSFYEQFLLYSAIGAFELKLKTKLGYDSASQIQLPNTPDTFSAGDIVFNRNRPQYKYRIINGMKESKTPQQIVEEFAILPNPLTRKNKKYIDEIDRYDF